MNHRRRYFTRIPPGVAEMGALRNAHAKDNPNRVVKIIVTALPGAIVDVEVGRVAAHLARALDQPVLVDNRPRSSNTIGTAVGAKAPPNGCTLTWGSISALSSAPPLMRNHSILT
jgi:tripartite-type tricarboxylate transporter receptor subunit TctC